MSNKFSEEDISLIHSDQKKLEKKKAKKYKKKMKSIVHSSQLLQQL